MKAYKIFMPTTMPNTYPGRLYSGYVGGQYELQYYPGEETFMLPNTVGIFCFSSIKAAMSYEKKLEDGVSELWLVKANIKMPEPEYIGNLMVLSVFYQIDFRKLKRPNKRIMDLLMKPPKGTCLFRSVIPLEKIDTGKEKNNECNE